MMALTEVGEEQKGREDGAPTNQRKDRNEIGQGRRENSEGATPLKRRNADAASSFLFYTEQVRDQETRHDEKHGDAELSIWESRSV